MARLFTFYLFILSGVLCSCSNHRLEKNVQIQSHHIELVIWPEQNSFSIIDSVGLHYQKVTDKFYFYLSESLFVDQISVGHLQFKFSKLPANHSFCKKCRSVNSSIYKVDIPVNLSPPSLNIYYSGKFVSDNFEPPVQSAIPWISHKDIAFPASSFWYPFLPGTMFRYSLSTLAPDHYELICNGQKGDKTELPGWRIARWSASLADRIDLYSASMEPSRTLKPHDIQENQ